MMRWKVQRWLTFVGLIGTLAILLGVLGCADSGRQAGSPRQPVATATPVFELDVPPVVADRLKAIGDAVVARAEALGHDIDLQDLDVVNAERREWPTTAMGCPDPDQVYAQVVTRGYALRVNAGSATYEVHVSDDGNLVVCNESAQAGAATAVPAATPGTAPAGDVGQFVEQAREALARQVERARDADVLDVQRREWPTAAMGCPEPGKSYAQVVTPGYVVRFGAADLRYEVHVSESGQVVVCSEGAEAQGVQVPDRAESVVAAVRADLAARLSVAPDELHVIEFESVEWRNSSLGCPRPGAMYLQVITPGYRAVIQGPDQIYEYHTDRSGDQMVLCEGAPAAEKATRVSASEARQVAERARQDLAVHLNVEPSEIAVVEALPLGQLPEPVPCPGADTLTGEGPTYQLRLEVGQETYAYRVQGDRLLLCSD